MSGKTTVFYAGRVHAQHDGLVPARKIYESVVQDAELFNGCIIHKDDEWYRGDLTPMLDEDVPNELRMLLLLIS